VWAPEARINYVIPSAPECVAADPGVVVGKPNVPASEIGADLHLEIMHILLAIPPGVECSMSLRNGATRRWERPLWAWAEPFWRLSRALA